jgi:uncharacterized membrane protein YfcA
MYFPVSGIEVQPALPFSVAFVVSFFTSMGGVSSAFLLLPFQVSVLGFTSPAVSPTNLIFNIVAIPGGVYRYIREGRMAWPLTWVIIVGTLPGLLIGAIIRIIIFYALPVYTIAGSALMGTFLTSLVGVGIYTIIAPVYTHTGLAIAPDWKLGILLGIGGLAGMYCGARAQKCVPGKVIRCILGLLITLLALRYVFQYFIWQDM